MNFVGLIYSIVTATSAGAVVMASQYRRLWLPTLGVCATAAGIVLYLPVREFFDPPVGSDPVGHGFGRFAEFIAVVLLLGPLHLMFFALFGSAALEELTTAEIRKRKVNLDDSDTHDISNSEPDMDQRPPAMVSIIEGAKLGGVIGTWVVGIAGALLGLLVGWFFAFVDFSWEGPREPTSPMFAATVLLIAAACLGYSGMAIGAAAGWLAGGILTGIGIAVLPDRAENGLHRKAPL